MDRSCAFGALFVPSPGAISLVLFLLSCCCFPIFLSARFFRHLLAVVLFLCPFRLFLFPVTRNSTAKFQAISSLPFSPSVEQPTNRSSIISRRCALPPIFHICNSTSLFPSSIIDDLIECQPFVRLMISTGTQFFDTRTHIPIHLFFFFLSLLYTLIYVFW